MHYIALESVGGRRRQNGQVGTTTGAPGPSAPSGSAPSSSAPAASTSSTSSTATAATTTTGAGTGPDGAPAVLLRAVGQRARALRLARQLTLDELSARSGVSRRTITLLEAGEANASLATLDKLARALGAHFGSLVVDRPVLPFVPEVSGEVAPVWQDSLGSSARLLVAYPVAMTTELWQWELAGGARYQAEADPPGSEELILVTSGELVVEVGDDRLALSPGGYLRLPSDRPYAYSNPGPGHVRFIRVLTMGSPG